MYVRVTQFDYDPAREEELFRIVDDHVFPAMKALPGFQSFTSGSDREAKRGVSITVWNDMDHAAGFREALGGLIQQLEDAGASFEPAQLYEITRHVTG